MQVWVVTYRDGAGSDAVLGVCASDAAVLDAVGRMAKSKEWREDTTTQVETTHRVWSRGIPYETIEAELRVVKG